MVRWIWRTNKSLTAHVRFGLNWHSARQMQTSTGKMSSCLWTVDGQPVGKHPRGSKHHLNMNTMIENCLPLRNELGAAMRARDEPVATEFFLHTAPQQSGARKPFAASCVRDAAAVAEDAWHCTHFWANCGPPPMSK